MTPAPPNFNDYFNGLGLSNAAESTGVKALIYGTAGVSKSSLAATATLDPRLSPVLVFDTEGGFRQPLRDWGNPDQAFVLQVPDWVTFAKAWQKVRQDLAKGTFQFKTIVIDTLDVLQEHIRDQGLKDNDNKFDIYAAVYDRVAALIKDVTAQPDLNLIVTTHAVMQEDEVSGATMVAPAFEGSKSAGRIPSRFDLVGRLGWAPDPKGGDGMVPVLVTRSKNSVAKRNIKSIPDALTSPTMSAIVDAVRPNGAGTSK